MKHICLDLNIILDVLLKRAPFFEDSYRIMKMIQDGLVIGDISAHHIDTLVYIIRKSNNSARKTLFTDSDVRE